MAAPVVLYGAGTARTLRPIWVAEELGITYKLVPIGPRSGETQTAGYTQLNPKQKVPVMVCGELCLSESLAICRYLIGNFNGGDFVRPTEPGECARLDEWCCYIYGELDETSLYVMRRHRDLASVYGEAPNAVASSASYAEKHLNVVAERMARRETVLEAGFSLADVLLQTCLDWAHAYSVAIPKALDHVRRHNHARPAYRRAVAANFPGGPPA